MNRSTLSVRTRFFAGLMVFSGPALLPAAGQLRCDLESALQNNVPKCLEVEELHGKTVNVPANVTRIDYDGLSLCAPKISGPGPVDVVFVLDVSGSMRGNDPSNYARTTTATSLQMLFDLAPQSSAGFIGFAKGVCDGTNGEKLLVPPAPLNQGTNLADLKDLATGYKGYDCGEGGSSGTDYYTPLNQTKAFLENPGYSKNPKKAVVFVSDGEPTVNEAEYEAAYAYAADPGLPQVFSIFIGDDGGPVLEQLSTNTGGFFYPIASGDTAALGQAMADIITKVVARAALASTIVTNQTNGQTAQAAEAGHEDLGSDDYRVTLNDVVALNEGPNTVTMEIAGKNDSTGAPQNAKAATFTLNVAAPASMQKGQSNVDGDFGIRCYDPSRLTATNNAGQTIPGLGVRVDGFGINLETAPSIVGDAVAAAASSPLSQDTETVGLPQSGANDSLKTFSGPADFAITRGVGQAGSNVLEAQPRDTVTVAWVHPRDPRDLAVLKLPVAADFRNAGIVEAYFDDPSADGLIDRVVLVLDPANPPNLQAIQANPHLLHLPPGLELESIAAGQLPNTLLLNVKPNQYVPNGTETAVVDEDPMQLVDGYLQPGTYPIVDRVAPVVKAAKLFPYLPVTGQLARPDTLRVVFSKPAALVNNSDRPFQLRSKDGTVYVFVLAPMRSSGDTSYFAIQSVEGALVAANRDSLWINPGHVADQAGNVQDKPHNKRALLEVVPLPELKAVEALAPVAAPSAQTAVFPEHWAVVRTGTISPQTFGNSSRKIVLVEPANSQAEQDSSLGIRLEASRPFTAEVLVYSHFGQYLNQVTISLSQQEFLQLGKNSEGKRELMLRWDGTDENGSRAGTGVYIFNARLTLKAQGNESISTTAKLIRVGLFRPQ